MRNNRISLDLIFLLSVVLSSYFAFRFVFFSQLCLYFPTAHWFFSSWSPWQSSFYFHHSVKADDFLSTHSYEQCSVLISLGMSVQLYMLIFFFFSWDFNSFFLVNFVDFSSSTQTLNMGQLLSCLLPLSHFTLCPQVILSRQWLQLATFWWWKFCISILNLYSEF